METGLIFNIDSQFTDVTYFDDSESWTFVFNHNIYVSSSGFWRLLKDKSIYLISLDHGQIFGLPEPLDLSKKIREILSGEKLKRINVQKDTGDLTLTLTNSLELQIFISSTGYETYDFQVENKRYIGLGGGNDIAIINNN